MRPTPPSLADAGAAVVCADINGSGAQAVAKAIGDAGGVAIAVAVDITDDASVAAMVQRAVAETGGVDILVNNAALMVQLVGGGSALQFPPELWDQAFAVNLKGAWNVPVPWLPT